VDPLYSESYRSTNYTQQSNDTEHTDADEAILSKQDVVFQKCWNQNVTLSCKCIINTTDSVAVAKNYASHFLNGVCKKYYYGLQQFAFQDVAYI